MPITLMIFGKVAVRGTGDHGRLFIGPGPMGWTKKFRWSEIKLVRMSFSKWKQNGNAVPVIELELDGENPIRFGSQLSEKRREFMLAGVAVTSLNPVLKFTLLLAL